MDCSTIIVSYNTFDLTREAVRTALEAAPGLAHEVVVVDNNSPDDSAARLRTAFPKALFPNVTVLANRVNAGFSKANNQGAAVAGGAVLFFLNPDTVVHGPAIRTLHTFLTAHPEAGAVGPRVLNTDGTDQPSTARLLTPARLLRHHLPLADLLRGRDRRSDPIPEDTAPVEIVNGCALALRHEVFNEVGGWDEAYFMYAEETELCYGLLQAGYTNYFVREAEITHYGGASSLEQHAEQQVVQQRSALQFLRKHHGPGLVVLNRFAGTLGFGVRAFLYAVLARLRRQQAAAYRRRGEASARLFRWFLLEYA